MKSNELNLKRESLTHKMDELEQKFMHQEKLVNEFAQINVEVIDRVVKLKNEQDEMMKKLIRVEVIAMKGFIESALLSTRIQFLESILVEQGLLDEESLKEKRAIDEERASVMEERFLKEGV